MAKLVLSPIAMLLVTVATNSCSATLDAEQPRDAERPRDAALNDNNEDRSAPNAVSCPQAGPADILFVIDNSATMNSNQARLAFGIHSLFDALVSPPPEPTTGLPSGPRISDIHVGVVSSDLGVAGNFAISCHDADVGDDGLMNPIRYGPATRQHRPFMVSGYPGYCSTDPNYYPTFLAFDSANVGSLQTARDFACYGYLAGFSGCGIRQTLEAAYRALIVHDARARADNRSPNAGFIRDEAVLAII